jgi:hypothetical protein
MSKQRLKKIYRSLKIITDSVWNKRLFVSLVLIGLMTSLIFDKPPILLILTFVIWTLGYGVLFFFDAANNALNRNLVLAVWLLLWFGVLISLSYLALRMLVQVVL